MKKLIRLIAEAKDLNDCKMILQLVVEDEKLATQEHFGYQKEEGDLYPFILCLPDSSNQAKQKVDFGECCETKATTNLFTRPIIVGEYFTLIEDEDEYTYQITHVTELM
ncbi:MAG: hypothetical protein M0Z50_13185 [Planctomycetia bacterium]|nr:hypothetical protein [Planctomycetia bacterium]